MITFCFLGMVFSRTAAAASRHIIFSPSPFPFPFPFQLLLQDFRGVDDAHPVDHASGLERVGGEGPDVADGLEQVLPRRQSPRDYRAARFEPLTNGGRFKCI